MPRLHSSGWKSGDIRIHNGDIETIPNGWVLCDGQNGSPDLCDRTIVGAGRTYARNQKFGSDTRAINKPSVSLSAITATVSKPSVTIQGHTLSTAQQSPHSHTRGDMNITGDVGNTTGNQSFNNPSGAFYRSGSSFKGHYANADTLGGQTEFDASLSWTGSTSDSGGGSSHAHGVSVGSQSVSVVNPNVTVGDISDVDTRQSSIAIIWIMKL